MTMNKDTKNNNATKNQSGLIDVPDKKFADVKSLVENSILPDLSKLQKDFSNLKGLLIVEVVTIRNANRVYQSLTNVIPQFYDKGFESKLIELTDAQSDVGLDLDFTYDGDWTDVELVNSYLIYRLGDEHYAALNGDNNSDLDTRDLYELNIEVGVLKMQLDKLDNLNEYFYMHMFNLANTLTANLLTEF